VNHKEAVEKALIAFPKLYYFVMPIRPFTVKVPPERVKKLARSLKIKEAAAKAITVEEPSDTILWLLSTLAQEQGGSAKTSCSQSHIRSLVTRCSPMNESQFTKELAKLTATDLITSSRTELGDRRSNELTLTDEGIKVLERIREQRRELLAFLFQKRTQIELKTIADSLEAVALATWPKIKEAIPDLSATTRTAAKSKSRKKARR